MQILPQSSQFRATQNQSTPLFVSGRTKPVAHYTPQTRTLTKGCDFTKHIVLKPKAIAFDADVMAQAEALGAQHIRVKDTATNDIYTATVETFRRYQFNVNRGFGAQLALTFDHWQRNGQPSEAEHRATAQAAREATKQLALFDAQPDYMEVYR